ncbi:MAG: polyprenyl synthetase family protein [Bacillota bacterium]
MEFETAWGRLRLLVDQGLEGSLSIQGQRGCPDALLAAMRHALMGGGKRLRPVLCLASSEACGVKAAAVLPAALSLEMVHAYSLVHDDLPCMDNAEIRRGLPTVHKAYGEATAVLAGDALLTLAFEVLSEKAREAKGAWPGIILELARAAGCTGIIAGQVADATPCPVSREFLLEVHRKKTGALFQAAARMGAMAAGASPETLSLLGQYGMETGRAYQLLDDLADFTDSEGLNAVRVIGRKETLAMARVSLDSARACLEPLGERARVLSGLLDSLIRGSPGQPL